MTLSYRTIKEEIEAGRYTVKRALEIIGVQHARQQITDDEYNELYSMATNLDATTLMTRPPSGAPRWSAG